MKKPNDIFNGPADTARPWFTIKNEASAPHAEILIYDQIGKDWTGEGTGVPEFVQALNQIPKERNVLVRLNTPGGNVYDGIAIYNRLAERGNVDTQVDGVCASIGVTIFLAGKKRRMGAGTSLMTHPPSMGTHGTKADHQDSINRLENAERNISAIYQKRAGISEVEANALLTGENWMSSAIALEKRLATETANFSAIQNNFDLSMFRCVPEYVRSLQNSAPQNGGQSSIMNRSQILARLKKLGKTVNESATDAELLVQLDAALDEVQNAATSNRAQQDNGATSAQNGTGAGGTTAASAAVAGASAPNAEMVNRITALEAQNAEQAQRYNAERRTRITNRVDELINERRVPASERAFLIEHAMLSEQHLTNAAARPQVMPDAPLNIERIGSSPDDIATGVKNFSAPIRAIERGNNIAAELLQVNARARSELILNNLPKLREMIIRNAHTIDSDLQRAVIMTERMEAFAKRIVPLGAFSTRFNDVPLLGNAKVEVPYYPLFTTASSDFVDDGTGYVFARSSDTQAKEVTINKRKYQPFEYSSAEAGRQPYFDTAKLLGQKLDQLSVDVWADIGSIFTVGNFGAAIFNGPAESFTPETIIDIGVACDQADWTGKDAGRSILLDSAYNGSIIKLLLPADKTGDAMALREGKTGRIGAFDLYGCPRIPANSISLKGVACLPSCALVATSPVRPRRGVLKQLVSYELIVHPTLGVTYEYRFWGDADKDVDREVVEMNYGYAVGESAAAKLITNA